MAEKKTNFEMLLWGVKHIAENHGFNSNTEDWEGRMARCAFGAVVMYLPPFAMHKCCVKI